MTKRAPRLHRMLRDARAGGRRLLAMRRLGTAGDLTMARPPLVIMGPHRAGTTMVAALLRDAGVHIGNDLDENLEARALLEINEWLLGLAGASWQYPKPFLDLLEDNATLERVSGYVRELVASGMVGSYADHRSQLDCWAWKDPRNCITLPIWYRVFPDLRVVNVQRHGVDVAESLRQRAFRAAEVTLDRQQLRSVGTAAHLADLKWVVMGTRVLVRQQGLEMWAEYADMGANIVNRLGPDRARTVRYEDLLTRPQETLGDLLGFLDKELRLPNASRTVRHDRCFAFRSDPALVGFAAEHAGILRRHGYSESGFASDS